MEDITLELLDDVIGAVFPGTNAVFADEFGQLFIDLEHGEGVTFQNLLWLSKVLGTNDISLEKSTPDAIWDDNTWSPELPCRLVCSFPSSRLMV